MKKYLYLILSVAMLLFMVAADVLPGTGVPDWAIMLGTAIVMPGLVAGAKWLSEKVSWLSWLNGKFWLSILTYLLAAGVVAVFVQWKAIPALPEDPGLAVPLIVVYVQAFFGAATGLYNVLIAPVHNRLSG